MEWFMLVLGAVLGVVADRAYEGFAHRLRRRQLDETLRPLQGDYQQYTMAGQAIRGANGNLSTTAVDYDGDGVVTLRSHTDYGDWTGQVLLDSGLTGSGTFAYDDASRGAGVVRLMVLDNDQGILGWSKAHSHPGNPESSWVLKPRDWATGDSSTPSSPDEQGRTSAST